MENKLIFEKINAIMSDVPAIGKDRKSKQQGYNFRGIDDMYNSLHTLFAKHQVFFTSELLASCREERETKNGGSLIYSILDIKFTFYAEDGSSISSTFRGEAMDSGDKASNKAASVALKYALMQMFLIPTAEDKDTENDSPEPIVKKQPKNELVDHEKAKLIDDYQKILTTPFIFTEEEKEKYKVGNWTKNALKSAIGTLNEMVSHRITDREPEKV